MQYPVAVKAQVSARKWIPVMAASATSSYAASSLASLGPLVERIIQPSLSPISAYWPLKKYLAGGIVM